MSLQNLLLADTPQVLDEDEDYLFIFKPAGWLSIKARRPKTEDHVIVDHFRALPVHRLDEDVAGVMLLAKNTKAQRIASSAFERRLTKKTYWAITTRVDLSLFSQLPFEIEPIEAQKGFSAVWKSKISRGKKRAYSSKFGLECETRARIIDEQIIKNTRLFLWELEPFTGRSHQLRWELARHEHPVLSDDLYFAPLLPRFRHGIALIAASLELPLADKTKKVTLDLSPKDLWSMLDPGDGVQIADKGY